MATAIEVMGDRVSKDVKNIADGHSQVFGESQGRRHQAIM